MAKPEKKKEGFWDTVKTVFWALVIAMAFRSFLYQPFSIPSGSMKPTLLVGDYLFVSKFSYGYSRYSFPFSPDLFSGRIWGGMPERGDVVVFKHPKQDQCSEGPIAMAARLGQTPGRATRARSKRLRRLHQARDRATGRPDPDDRRRAAYQRPAGRHGAHRKLLGTEEHSRRTGPPVELRKCARTAGRRLRNRAVHRGTARRLQARDP